MIEIFIAIIIMQLYFIFKALEEKNIFSNYT